jgi:predicted PurR-regulated permease PerM
MAMFISVLFLPLMRWLTKKRTPRVISLFLIIAILLGILKIGGELIQLSLNEILSADTDFFVKAEEKLVALIVLIESFFGIERLQGENVIIHYFKDNNILTNVGATLGFITSTLTMTLMTVFFVVLLLAESINFQKILEVTVFKKKFASVKTFLKIEKDIIRFVKVKIVISLFTGLGFGLACWLFGVDFPIFWGLFAFAINFIQMLGSFISVILLSLFAFVEIDSTGTLLFFIIVITSVQVLMGGVLEPIFMGKTFSLNVVTVLIMLMLWGYIWGIPGLIMSIPITVFAKIILEQFPKTQVVATMMSGPEIRDNKFWRKKR